MSNVPKLRFKEFGGEWKKMNGNLLFETITNKKHNSDLPVLAITQEHGAIPRDMIDFKISVSDASVATYKVVEIGDFIISLRSFQGGIEHSKYKGICSPAYIILRPMIELDDSFYKHYFKTVNYIKELNRHLEGIRDGKMVSYKQFSEIKLPLPSKQEQEKIALFLTSVDTKIEQLIKKETLLTSYKKGVMQKIFNQEIRFKADDGSEFCDWEEKKLGDIFSGIKGQGLSKGDIVENGVNKCILYGELYTSYPEIIKEVISKTNSINGVKSLKGDLLIPCSTTTTRIDLADVTVLYEDNVLLGGDITILRFKKNGNSTFFGYYLTHYKKYDLAKYGQGSTIVHMYYSHFKTMIIKIPPSIQEQNKIANFLSSIDSKIEQVNKQLHSIKEFKKALLQQMFV